MSRRSDLQEQSGFILMTLLVSVFFIMTIGVVTTQLVTSNLQLANVERHRLNAQLAADAGIDYAIIQVNQDTSWDGTATEQVLYEDDKIKTTYQIDVEEIDTLNKLLQVTGKTYAPKDSPDAHTERKYEVALRGVGGGEFSVVTGVGGLILRNNAKILDGKVFVNGTIQMFNSSQIGLDLIGIPLIPVPIHAGHYSCPVPANSTYPRLCAPGENGQPIMLHNNAKIYGRVMGNNQTDGSNMFAPGLVGGSVTQTAMPEYDRAAHKAAATSNVASGYACGQLLGIPLVGIKYWPANAKISGNVTIPLGCTVYVAGNVWITGNLTISPGGIMIVNPSLNTSPVIMIDGGGGLDLNGGTITPSLNGKGIRFITFHNATGNPDAIPTGVNLYNSQNLQTIHVNGLAIVANSELYSRWSKLLVSNAVSLGALAGQTIEIRNSATITFGATVSGFNATSGWVVKYYKRVF